MQRKTPEYDISHWNDKNVATEIDSLIQSIKSNRFQDIFLNCKNSKDTSRLIVLFLERLKKENLIIDNLIIRNWDSTQLKDSEKLVNMLQSLSPNPIKNVQLPLPENNSNAIYSPFNNIFAPLSSDQQASIAMDESEDEAQDSDDSHNEEGTLPKETAPKYKNYKDCIFYIKELDAVIIDCKGWKKDKMKTSLIGSGAFAKSETNFTDLEPHNCFLVVSSKQCAESERFNEHKAAGLRALNFVDFLYGKNIKISKKNYQKEKTERNQAEIVKVKDRQLPFYFAIEKLKESIREAFKEKYPEVQKTAPQIKALARGGYKGRLPGRSRIHKPSETDTAAGASAGVSAGAGAGAGASAGAGPNASVSANANMNNSIWYNLINEGTMYQGPFRKTFQYPPVIVLTREDTVSAGAGAGSGSGAGAGSGSGTDLIHTNSIRTNQTRGVKRKSPEGNEGELPSDKRARLSLFNPRSAFIPYSSKGKSQGPAAGSDTGSGFVFDESQRTSSENEINLTQGQIQLQKLQRKYQRLWRRVHNPQSTGGGGGGGAGPGPGPGFQAPGPNNSNNNGFGS